VYKDFPLPTHPNAQKAAEAARCAGEQGKYWEYHDLLFTNQSKLDVANLKKFAADLQLNTTRFNTCLDNGTYAEKIRQDVTEGQRVGVGGTPAFFINGRLLAGAQPFSAFQQIIDEVLAEQAP
jgi:protein-disulfide isomerase